MNELLKKMLHKNYEFLAEFTREPPPIDTEKEIEILKAEIENSNKVIAVQESEKVKVFLTLFRLQGIARKFKKRKITNWS